MKKTKFYLTLAAACALTACPATGATAAPHAPDSIDGGQEDYVLSVDTMQIQEVVVTALGIRKEAKSLSYHVQEIKGDDLPGSRDANFVNSLNGRVAGVTINSSASGTGGASRVVMRGAKSINGNNNVLVVVDGIDRKSVV